jgi:nicotinamide-nucleotide amidase
MAGGALIHSPADLAVAITGIAGPDGGTPDKPVGLVYFAAGRRDEAIESEGIMFGDLGRNEVQRRSVVHALKMLRALV